MSISTKFPLFGLFLAAVVLLPPVHTQAQETQNGAPSTEEKATEKEGETEKSSLEKKIEQLELENKLFQLKLKKELRSLKAEQKRLSTKQRLEEQRQESELSDLEKKKKKLETQLELSKKQKEKDLSELENEIKQLQTELDLSKKKAEKALQDLKTKKEKLNTQMELKEAEKMSDLSQLRLKLQEKKLLQSLEKVRMKLNEAKLSNIKLERELELAKKRNKKSKMEADIEVQETRKKWKKQISNPIDYHDEPLQDDTLYITDRRINLNGPIIDSTGEWVSNRIHYFNNQSEEHPIFIVIDDSPGGSVMEGFRILKTMKSTEAPVYVVVKERAASLAAAITTLADRSFAYPDAIILHHEIQSSMGGSLTESEEELKMMKKWWKRFATPIAEKMGITLEEFRNRMYEQNSNGDWQEFATDAQELNWVDHIIQNIEDASVREEPAEEPPSPTIFFLEKDSKQIKKDDQGRYYRKLPPLRPFDFYYMYDPKNNYRW